MSQGHTNRSRPSQVAIPDSVLDWAIRAIAASRVLDVVPLPGWSPWPPVLLRLAGGRASEWRVLRTRTFGHRRHDAYAREVRALTIAEHHQIVAPRVIGVDLDGKQAGQPAVLTTALPGRSSRDITTVEQLRAYGAAVGSLRVACAQPDRDLKLSTEPLDVDNAAAERRRAMRYESATEIKRTAIVAQYCGLTGAEPQTLPLPPVDPRYSKLAR